SAAAPAGSPAARAARGTRAAGRGAALVRARPFVVVDTLVACLPRLPLSLEVRRLCRFVGVALRLLPAVVRLLLPAFVSVPVDVVVAADADVVALARGAGARFRVVAELAGLPLDRAVVGVVFGLGAASLYDAGLVV